MKKMKFRKLSRVLICISLLAIIAVSLISVPVSAVLDAESVIGTWVFNEQLVLPSSIISENSFGNIDGTYHLVDSSDYSVYEAPIGFVIVNQNPNQGININFSGDGLDNGNYGFPALYILSNKVQIYSTPSNITEYRLSNGNISPEDYELLRTITIDSYIPSSNAQPFYDFLEANATKIVPPSPTLLENILGTFSEVGSWIGTIISSLVALFWSVETASLTFLGILSVAGLCFSVIMLLFGFVIRFVGFSG